LRNEVAIGKSGKQILDSDDGDRGAAEDERHLVARMVVAPVTIARWDSGSGRGGIDLDLVVDEVDNPVGGNACLRVERALVVTISFREVLATSMTRTMSAGPG
jgi:hypothetical protein